jgi:hypothetical protein
MFTTHTSPIVVFQLEQGGMQVYLRSDSLLDKCPLLKTELKYFRETDSSYEVFIECDDRLLQVNGEFTYNDVINYVNTF